MSHIATVEVEIKDLDCFEQAAKQCGLEFVRDKKTFRAYRQRNKCDHAIRAVDGGHACYEAGLRSSGEGVWKLAYDSHMGGYGLQSRIALDDDTQGAGRLMQRYSVEVAKKAARKQGFRVTESAQVDGSIKLVCRR